LPAGERGAGSKRRQKTHGGKGHRKGGEKKERWTKKKRQKGAPAPLVEGVLHLVAQEDGIMPLTGGNDGTELATFSKRGVRKKRKIRGERGFEKKERGEEPRGKKWREVVASAAMIKIWFSRAFPM